MGPGSLTDREDVRTTQGKYGKHIDYKEILEPITTKVENIRYQSTVIVVSFSLCHG
jgi:hypothetical protein